MDLNLTDILSIFLEIPHPYYIAHFLREIEFERERFHQRIIFRVSKGLKTAGFRIMDLYYVV